MYKIRCQYKDKVQSTLEFKGCMDWYKVDGQHPFKKGKKLTSWRTHSIPCSGQQLQ